jgi:transposase
MTTASRTTVPSKKPRKKYTKDFKLEAVKLARHVDVGFAKAAKDIDVHESLLRSWAAKQDKQGDDAHRGQGRRATLEAEIARLQRENRTLLMEMDFLKKTAAYFAKEIG